jgi:hypothetical protein
LVKAKSLTRQTETRREDYLAYQKAYRDQRVEERRQTNAEWRKNNQEHHRANARKWYQENKARRYKYVANRLKNDVLFRLRRNISNRLRTALSGKAKPETVQKTLGCTSTELKVHLESMFLPGMVWENYGTEWEIDHILPLANYRLDDRATYRILSHYTNLQPMFKSQNRIKSNKEFFHGRTEYRQSSVR